MIKEDYVSFEIAKLLKEKGFKEITQGYITADKEVYMLAFQEGVYELGKNKYPYPTLQMTMKWLRKAHNLYIQPKITAWPQKGYFVKIYLYNNRYNNFEEVPFVEHKESYEQACEAAIKYCLENLI